MDPSIPRAIPLIELVLDRPRHLLIRKRDVRQAEIVFEQETGKPGTFAHALWQMVQCLQPDQDPMLLSMTNACVLTWLALRHEDPTLTLEDVEDLLPLH